MGASSENGPLRILVVEDEAVLANAVVEVLRKSLDAEVDLALTGVEARELSDQTPYALVVLDWGIPPPSGMELLREWRTRGNTQPVLILSGREDAEIKAATEQFGADGYMTKPFSLIDLRDRAKALVNSRTDGRPSNE